VFGTSLSEIAVVGVVALVVVGPQKLPTMLRTLGQWTGRLRRMTMEMRAKTGIDEILREEGIDGVAELRSLLRGEVAAARQAFQRPLQADPYQDDAPVDLALEYPSEGVDTMGAIPEDLLVHSRSTAGVEDDGTGPEEEGTGPETENAGTQSVVAEPAEATQAVTAVEGAEAAQPTAPQPQPAAAPPPKP
jgi:sec-independent protein translocase protein TatB